MCVGCRRVKRWGRKSPVNRPPRADRDANGDPGTVPHPPARQTPPWRRAARCPAQPHGSWHRARPRHPAGVRGSEPAGEFRCGHSCGGGAPNPSRACTHAPPCAPRTLFPPADGQAGTIWQSNPLTLPAPAPALRMAKSCSSVRTPAKGEVTVSWALVAARTGGRRPGSVMRRALMGLRQRI